MIGLCIKYYNKNYGSMLQCYALTKFLELNNFDYEIIRYKKKKNISMFLKNLPRLFNKILINDKKEVFKKKIGLLLNDDFRKNNSIREECFNKFCDDYFLNLSNIYNGYSELKKGSKNYDVVLSGSDQLWSPAGLPSHFYTLEFCDKSVKRVSYASSFGVSYVPWYQKKRTKKYLLEMNAISVREEAGKKIINKLINKEVSVVVDPVMLLSKNQWDELIENKLPYNFEYIFAYFLGDNKKYREDVVNFSKRTGLKIVTLRHLDQFVSTDEKFGDYAPYNVGPVEFLNLIRNAKYVFTDSFHGSVFSIINHKNFISFNRYPSNSSSSKNSRIDTLLSSLNLSDRRYNENIDYALNFIDYKEVDKKMNQIVLESKKYLIENIEVNNYD